ncbi:MAG: glutaredoxin [Methanophagales archaeon ANME-1-THS]|nr:MAG: glutaredoxin [Methanophagales archaeon ANME-1-THS]
MALLSEKVRQEVEHILEGLKGGVKLVVFTQEFECPTCEDNRMLMEELAACSSKIQIEVLDFVRDKEKAELYKLDKIPATVVEGKEDYGIRFYGVPGGYEFASLLHAITMVSSGSSTLSPKTKEQLKRLSKPVHIQVFVTHTCPYCPEVVQLAHEMALESPLITSDMVNAAEFPHLNHKYDIFVVPKTIINETIQFAGAVPESEFLKHVLKAEKR